MRSDPIILVIVPNWLGDVVMSLPALDALRAKGTLVALGAPAVLALLTDTARVDATVAYDRKGADRGLGGLWKVARAARATRPAQVVAMPPSLRAATLAALTNAPSRHGFGPRPLGCLLNGRRPTPPRSTHLADAWLALAQQVPVGAMPAAMPHLEPGPAGRSAWDALRRRRGVDGDYFVVAPGATYGPTKRWPEASYVELAKTVASRRSWTAVVVGGRNAHERDLCARVAAGSGGHDTAGDTDLPALAALLAGARAFVGNDSGPMHLAAAVGTPTVGIFGSTSPAWTAPRGSSATTCGPYPVDCSPCFRRNCPIGLPCLDKLSVGKVLQSLGRVVGEG